MIKIEHNIVREKVYEFKNILLDCTSNRFNGAQGKFLIIRNSQLKELVDILSQIIKIYEKEINELNEKIVMLEENQSSYITW